MINTSMIYLYQINNLVNNKIYVGVHKTDNINDGYMGSGKAIMLAIEKYGLTNFRKDILEYFDTYDAALAREAEIVTDDFLLREDVYNLRRGGSGGFDYINRLGLNDRSGATLSERQKNNISVGRLLAVTDEFRAYQSIKMLGNSIGIGNSGNKNPRTASHKAKIAKKISESITIYEIVKCPVCNKTGSKNAMKRWHFEKCNMRD
jgi:hypothetical protein